MDVTTFIAGFGILFVTALVLHGISVIRLASNPVQRRMSEFVEKKD